MTDLVSKQAPLVAALAILIAAGSAPGRWGGRRASDEALRAAAVRIGRLPLAIGDWAGEEAPIDRRGLDRAGISGLVSRRYVNRRTGAVISLLLVCGPPGPIAAHGPEACYSGSGYEAEGPPVRHAWHPEGREAGEDAFWVADFRSRDAEARAPRLRIAWSWSEDGRWEAPDRPRLRFSGRRVLYKLYVVHEPEGPGDETGLAFAREVAPVLRPILSPDAAGAVARSGTPGG